MTERELKFLIDREAYGVCRERFTERFGEGTARLQLNYYYDDGKRTMHKSGVTVRVRQIEGGLFGQVKFHDKGAGTESREEYFEVKSLPKFIVFGGVKLKMLGSLATFRRTWKTDGLVIDLDEDYYLGRTDRELEIEYQDGTREAAEEIFRSLGIEPLEKRGGKYSRFLSARREMSDSEEFGIVFRQDRP